MPNRFIKESICTSENLNTLSPEAEILFYRLIVNCDDYGRLDARPSILRAKCFPLKLDTISDQQILSWLKELCAAALISFYKENNKIFLTMVTWAHHQQRRAKFSKYPEPTEDNLITYDILHNHLIAYVPVNEYENDIRYTNIHIMGDVSNETCAVEGKTVSDKAGGNGKTKKKEIAKILQSERGERIKEVFARLDKIRGYKPPKRKAEAAAILRMLKTYSPNQIVSSYEKLKSDNFWQSKELFMMTVESQIGAILNAKSTPSTRQVKQPSEYSRPED